MPLVVTITTIGEVAVAVDKNILLFLFQNQSTYLQLNSFQDQRMEMMEDLQVQLYITDQTLGNPISLGAT